MPSKTSGLTHSAPAKIILLGEHAVVYGSPAIALPVPALRAYAHGSPSNHPLAIASVDLDERITYEPHSQENDEHPMQTLMHLFAQHVGRDNLTGQITIKSSIPIASGLGSGAATSTATLRALGSLLRVDLDSVQLNDLVFAMEKVYHGTPSGIDNTVIVYEKAVYYQKNIGLDFLDLRLSCHLVIANSGRTSSTRAAVNLVKRHYQENRATASRIIEGISSLVLAARDCLERDDTARLGPLMSENHRLLQALGVSCPALDALVDASIAAGALGAKLSGGGLGGNMIALVKSSAIDAVKQALVRAGAKSVLDMPLDSGREGP